MGQGRREWRPAVALRTGRAGRRLSQRLGRGSGSMIGGRVALRLDPRVLGHLAEGRRTVLVTGTNGKSTVTALVGAALGAAGPVATNGTGANMPDGIVTALDLDRTSRYAALEVDEVYLGPVVQQTRPAAIVVLNAYREYTRGVALSRTLEHWRAVAADLPHDCVVVQNIDDPLVCWGWEPAARRVGVAGGLSWQSDASLCPACGAANRWEGAHWHCPGCGRSRPTPDWAVRPAQGTDRWIAARGPVEVPLRVHMPGRTGPVGAAFALAAAQQAGVDPVAAAPGIEQVQDVDGRYRPFPIAGRSARLVMLKNPAGWAEAIDAAVTEGLPMVVAVDPFGPKDTTTMWEAPFGRLVGHPVQVTGSRALDAMAVLEAAGVIADQAPDLHRAVLAMPPGDVLVACNYPAFRRVSSLLRRAAR